MSSPADVYLPMFNHFDTICTELSELKMPLIAEIYTLRLADKGKGDWIGKRRDQWLPPPDERGAG